MDSKLKTRAVMTACFLVVLLLGVVLWGNLSHSGKTKTSVAESIAETENTPLYQNGQIGDNLSAFKEDSTFFDVETDPFLEELMQDENRLSLIVTSIEKDLRIQIVDEDNKPVKGESFFVTLKGQGEYKDLDKDGVIYIGDLPAGAYELSLKPVEGYKVPTEAMDVTVKEKVEYVCIEDITLLMKTEADIDAEAEDTAAPIEDADKTEVAGTMPTHGNSTLGIDVSKWQKEIDWDKVKNDGIDFAIIRCGYRGSSTGSLIIDPYFEQNIKGAKAAGIKVGVYFFTQAVNEVEAVEEASMALSLVKDYDLEYPIFFDTEGAGGKGRADTITVEERTAICEAFLSTIKNAGYDAGIYASRNWYNNKLDMAGNLDRYIVWLAEYRSTPIYQGYYHIWQYSSKGKVDGISGNVDMDISYLGR